MSTTEMLVIAVGAVIVLIIIALVVVAARRKRKRDSLKQRYGAEYARTVDEVGSKRRAEGQLADREARREQLDIRPLSSGQRANLRSRFEAIESSFLDSPDASVRSADALLDEIAEERGYPEATAEQRLEDLAVDHPAAVDRYRKSRPSSDQGRASTEQHRQALIGSRALFESLLGRDADAAADPARVFDVTDRARAGGATGEDAHAPNRRAPRSETSSRP